MGLVGVLLPMWAALALLGSSLGLTPDQVDGKYVYYSGAEVARPDGSPYTGFACDRRLFTDPGARQAEMCGDLPDGTAIVYTLSWAWGRDFIAYLVRHEAEHLLRGPDGPEGDPYNEAAAWAAGCAAVPTAAGCH